ncbi:hypothetical protein C0J52_15745 [Blattella germanica]|nr:hypothetical protein C0J52_15745 [Blattella germanica]
MSQILNVVRRTARGRTSTEYEDLDEHGLESLPSSTSVPRELDESYDNHMAAADEIEMTSVSVVPDDSMEMTILSILSPALHCDWHITRYQQALTTTIVFLGMMLSSTFWGNLSDRYGRKQCFWALGACFEVLLALVIMPTLGWHWLLALSTIPLLAFAMITPVNKFSVFFGNI